MVGQTETSSDYDEDWESLLDSGILEALLQKAENENAVKRASQLTEVANLPEVENLPDCEILEDLIQEAERESALKRATQVVHTFSTPQTLQTLVPPSVDPSVQPSCILSTSVPVSNTAHVSGRAPLHTENAFNIRSQAFNGPRKPPLPFEQLRGSQGYYQDRYEGTHLPTNLSQLPTQTPGSLRYGAPGNGAVSTPNQPSNGVSGLHRDGGLHVNELAERNRTISVLRSKVQQVDSELYELRRKLAAQASSQHVPQFQQRELERLSLELSFKDQEVLEARRACDEKDDRLRDALASAAALKEELQNLKRLSSVQISVDKAGPSYSQDDEDDAMIAACDDRQLEVIHAHAKAQSKKLDQGQETWSALWEIEKPQHVASHKAVTSKESFDATVLKARTVDDGCVTSNQKKTEVLPPQASELPCREHTSGGNGASAPAPQQVIPGRGLGLEDDVVPRELTHSLQQIWNPRGCHNESVSLVSELFSVCRHDLYILLTFEGTLKDAVKDQTASETTGSKSIIGVKRKQALNTESRKLQESVGSKLHDALAKVANKHMPSATILGPLLEYCNCDNVDLVQSALHVLRCILRQDSFCRDKVLARKSAGSFLISKHSGISESFSRLNITHEGRGWFIPSGDMRQEQISLPVFSSRRVFCGPSKLQNGATTDSLGPEQVEHRRNISEDEARAMHHDSDEVDMASLDLNPFVDGLLDMAAHSPTLGIRFEATATMGLLVAHTEPVSERAQFGSLLWYGRLASLLKETAGETAGVRVQLQAIRLVHLLLHCPILLRMFCSALDTSLGGCWCELRKQGEARAEEARIHIQSLEMQGKGECKVVLDGISSCLECSGSSLQAYVLRRDAIHVLDFLASSGDATVRILLHAQIKLEQSVPFKESNISTDGGNGLQSENPQEGSRKHSGTGDVGAATVFNGERCFDIPYKLISLLARELKAEEDEAASAVERVGCEEDRACLIRETVKLFSKLLSNQLHSREVLNSILASKETTRLILGVIDQLIRRGSQSWPGASSSTDLVELARDLQNKIVPELTPL